MLIIEGVEIPKEIEDKGLEAQLEYVATQLRAAEEAPTNIPKEG